MVQKRNLMALYNRGRIEYIKNMQKEAPKQQTENVQAFSSNVQDASADIEASNDSVSNETEVVKGETLPALKNHRYTNLTL